MENIAENPYMQYFLGLSSFRQEPLFDESMMIHFRKRFPQEKINQINEELHRRTKPTKPPDGGDNDGTMILAATAASADIRYPTDLSLLNEYRENTEKIIDMAAGRNRPRWAAYRIQPEECESQISEDCQATQAKSHFQQKR